MKSTILFFLGFLLIVSACKNPNADKVNVTVNSDTTNVDTMADVANDPPAAPVDSATMMKAWEAFVTPGPMHQMLAKGAGTWTGDVMMWMDPADPPETSKATITNKMALNGLYQLGDYKGTMMGQPFEGHSILAYDNAKKEFVNTWIDNMGSGVVIMRGTWNDGTKTLSLKGTQTDPVTGKDLSIREEWKMIDDNSFMMTMYGDSPMGEGEHKFMEGTFKRKM